MKNKLLYSAFSLKNSFVAYANKNNLSYKYLTSLFVDEASIKRLGKFSSFILYNLISVYLLITGRLDLPGSPGIHRKCRFCTSLSIKLSELYLMSIYSLYLNNIPTLHYLFSNNSSCRSITQITDRKIKKIFGSPSSVLSYPWSAIFHICSNYQLVGYVHGGGYGEFDSNTIEKFECSASDQYICWGVGEYKKEVCGRFPYVSDNNNNSIKRFIIPEFDNERMIALDFLNHTAFLMISNFFKKLIFDIDKNLDLPVLLKTHPKMNLSCGIDTKNLPKVKFIGRSDLIIIGHPFSTFFYKCLNELHPFIILYERAWIDNFSQSYKNVLLSARNLGLLFFYDELNLINRYSNPKYFYNINNIKIFRDKVYEQ